MSNRLLIGNRPNGNIGFYVSKPGIDVNTASSGQFIFSSDELQSFQIIYSAASNVPSPPGGTGSSRFAIYPQSIPDLGYFPIILTSFNVPVNLTTSAAISLQVQYINNTTVNFIRFANDGAGPIVNWSVVRGQLF